MSLKIYNTMAGEKQVFEPLVPDTVTMYVCGPTVYNLAHIGNARPVVVFDTLFRLLQTHYGTVTYARNITDVDDKIITAAHEGSRSIDEVTDEFTAKYREDMAQLNALPPTLEPHATHNIEPMIRLTQTLIEKGHAYESQGHVLFAVESMEDYGKLSGRSLDDMLAGARVEVADYKRHPGDFVLWKPADDADPGWDSPWGRGRPGWHLECSAMIREHLGETIDIHGGGRDLIFPHHENEIAQSRCAHGGDYVNYWMHNAYLDIDGEKMSKSLGNFRTVRDLLDSYRGEVLRFALLSAHYRSPLNFSAELLDQAQSTLDSLYSTLREVADIELEMDVPLADEAFYAALNDDLNTPVAIAEIHALAKALNKATDADKPALKARIIAAGNLLGILGQDPEEWLQAGGADGDISAEDIEVLIDERAAAKKNRDFARADEIRESLLAQGVVLEDSREGTKWKRG
ncbi:cysteine--tRNA ligase [Halioglobus japonicus]|uniref:Cysteine--tRNA ligase n=1 Tax=Halioglobus japonicus TaxID=930805 RepID=A0AAP8MFA8_9GAMM|nr:cysteine--tRNA ligase [Halioglobus japonicus]AQA18724.1 cysteine--tRNA ligase [Halioglobus japonicus]PLW86751.1 cysteine--tRNA ligase [Halioglobus japonicus]GHD11245.1 cysteine--tRNA ligase [Halioglobus japonicus]